MTYQAFKLLKLVDPDSSIGQELQLEAPTFVSPYIEDTKLCPDCNQEYKPLIYQVGYETRTHHQLPCTETYSRGIYVTSRPHTANWLATVECYNVLTKRTDDFQSGQDIITCEYVIPRSMLVFCVACHASITQGSVIVTNDLEPMCHRCNSNPYHEGRVIEAKYTFVIRNGVVFFMKVFDKATTPFTIPSVFNY